MRCVIGEIVEQHVAYAPAEHHAQRAIDEQIVKSLERGMRRSVPQGFAGDERARIQPAENQSGNIGERIPADRQRADMDENGIDDGVRKRKERHAP